MASTKHNASEIEAHAQATPLWRNRNYLLLWSGQAISSLGSEASQLALPLLILSLTHSAAQAGLAGALRSLAYLLLGLPAGALADRWDRKQTMIFCDAGRALALGSIPLAVALGRLTMPHLYVVSLIEGTLYVFFSLADSAALPGVVARVQLPSATAQNEVTAGVATLIGPSLGGTLFGLAHALPFLVDAMSYAASVASLAWIHVPLRTEGIQQSSRLVADVREGLGWLWREPVIRALAVLHGGLVLCLSGVSLLMLVIAAHQHAAPFAIGLMFAISGLGGIVGAALGGQVHRYLRLGQIMVGAFWLFAVIWPLFAIAPSLIVLGAILATLWVVDEIYDVAQISYRLAIIPDALRGRVTGAFRLVTSGCDALGIALTGLLLQQIGVLGTILCVEVALVLLAGAVTMNRAMRAARPLVDL